MNLLVCAEQRLIIRRKNSFFIVLLLDDGRWMMVGQYFEKHPASITQLLYYSYFRYFTRLIFVARYALKLTTTNVRINNKNKLKT